MAPAAKPQPLPLTPNRMVAVNLRAARFLRGWSQEEAARRLRWSAASLSAAERSVMGRRDRSFTLDELILFATVFEVPVTYFLVPPPPTIEDKGVQREVVFDKRSRLPSNWHKGAAALLDLVFGSYNAQALIEHFRAVVKHLPPTERTAWQNAVENTAARQVFAALTERYGEQLAEVERKARDLADLLVQVKRQEEVEAVKKHLRSAKGLTKRRDRT